MSVTVGVNHLSVVHAGSGGVVMCFFDICNTPTPSGPLPVPYPNVAKSSDAGMTAKKVMADGEKLCVSSSHFSISTGDEAGSLGGVVSRATKGKAVFINYSFDVKAEGKSVARALDLMLQNDQNTTPMPLGQGPIATTPGDPDKNCIVCGVKL